MTYTCRDCFFCEAIEDEEYKACQFRQALVMGSSHACDYFELNRALLKEKDKVTDINEYTNDLQDEYTNTTELPKVKILQQDGDDIYEYAPMGGLHEVLETMENEYEEDNTPREPTFFKVDNTGECNCDYCNANSYPKRPSPETMDEENIRFILEDIKDDTEILLERLALLPSHETTTKLVLKAILGIEVDMALLKQLLLDAEE